jgi:hypothetical protein
MPAIQRGEHLAKNIEEFEYDTVFLAGMHEATDQAALQGDREDA